MDLKLIVGIIGNAIAVSLFASPIPTFWKIHKNKSTQDYDPLPYVCALFNCLLWVLYGLPFVTENALLVITINSIGCAFEICYIILFLSYAQRKTRARTLKVLLSCLALYAVIVVVTLAVLKKRYRKLEVGSLCVILNILMYASPLSVMKMVITTRSVEFMPLPLSLCVFLNSTVWMAYGVFSKDIFIMVPNGLGMLSGIAQLALYAIYKNAPPRPSATEQLKSSNGGVSKDQSMKSVLMYNAKSPKSPRKKVTDSEYA